MLNELGVYMNKHIVNCLKCSFQFIWSLSCSFYVTSFNALVKFFVIHLINEYCFEWYCDKILKNRYMSTVRTLLL